MTYTLTATITHKSFEKPIVHHFNYTGDTLDQVLGQIDTLPQHIKNLRHHGKAAFKDATGIKHSWVLKEIKHD